MLPTELFQSFLDNRDDKNRDALSARDLSIVYHYGITFDMIYVYKQGLIHRNGQLARHVKLSYAVEHERIRSQK